MSHSFQPISTKLTTTILLLSFILAACAPPSTAAPGTQPPATQPPAASDTPLPPGSDATTTPAPTQTVDAGATATQAAQSALGQVFAFLQTYGLPSDTGHLAWVQTEPVTLFLPQAPILTPGATLAATSEVAAIGTQAYELGIPAEVDDLASAVEGLTAGSFVWRVNVTWESLYGFAGCGLLFRSEPDLQFGEQFMFFTYRLYPFPYYDVYLVRGNEIFSSPLEGLNDTEFILQKNGSTNEFILVAERATLTLFANGTRLNRLTIATRAEGGFGFYASQQSGATKCTFSDGWLWVLDE